MNISTALAIMMACCVVGPAIAQCIVAGKAMDAMARQPEKAGDIRTAMLIALGLIEALTIYGLIIGLSLVGKI